MKAFWAMAALGLGLMGAVTPAPAQYPGDYGYRERPDYDRRDYRERREYREREEYGERRRERGYGFNERDYLRCNPDVARAVRRGEAESGYQHFQLFGRREGRRLSC
ncbi:MAG: hypothetical protein JO048_03455 [Methylobacteriaceae bacterium]|nr:hypothetical protein [Methylobacteriaceae bacterium]